MKVIPGEKKQVTTTVEVGTKYIAEDGTKFDDRYKCEEYENQLKRNQIEEKILSIKEKIFSQEIQIPFLAETSEDRYYIYTLESEAEFKEIRDLLKKERGIDNWVYFDSDFSKKYTYPLKCILRNRLDEFEDSRDSEYFTFCPLSEYIENTEKDLNTLKSFMDQSEVK